LYLLNDIIIPCHIRTNLIEAIFKILNMIVIFLKYKYWFFISIRWSGHFENPYLDPI